MTYTSQGFFSIKRPHSKCLEPYKEYNSLVSKCTLTLKDLMIFGLIPLDLVLAVVYIGRFKIRLSPGYMNRYNQNGTEIYIL